MSLRPQYDDVSLPYFKAWFEQVDVVEALHFQLLAETSKGEGLVAATAGGPQFVSKVIGGTLLDNRAITVALSSIFEAALRLCSRLAVGTHSSISPRLLFITGDLPGILSTALMADRGGDSWRCLPPATYMIKLRNNMKFATMDVLSTCTSTCVHIRYLLLSSAPGFPC